MLASSNDEDKADYISAIGYTHTGEAVCDMISTTTQPAAIHLTPQTGATGLIADGADIAYFDIEVVDKDGRICPLCHDKIDFELSGPAIFLGGYNSGRYNGYGKQDSPIHQNHVYAECGTNRVFIRAGATAGEITLKATMNGIESEAKLTNKEPPSFEGDCSKNPKPPSSEGDWSQTESAFAARPCDLGGPKGRGLAFNNPLPALHHIPPQPLEPSKTKTIPQNNFTFTPIPQADANNYTPDTRTFCSVVINNGHEVDTKGNRTQYLDGAVWGPILIILARIKSTLPSALDYTYDETTHKLTVTSGKTQITANLGQTHLQINGEENLMNGEPTLKNGMLWMEINAIVSHIEGISAIYDESVHIYRVDTL